MRSSYFSTGVFTFLRELTANNNREWWEENKDRYVRLIREPAKEFIADFEPRLHAISDHFVADTRTSGGSLMRPYRDTRFSKDKTPYKTNVGIQFRHQAGKDVHAPGFYVHIAPRDCWAGVGMWRPEPKVARKIREAIHDHPDDWKKATRYKAFTNVWTIEPDEEELLKRVPREFDPEFVYADDLRLKTFTAGHKMTQKTVTSPDFDDIVGTAFRAAGDYTGFLCSAIGLPY
jgi:uncharacterized protein (TIGR02453 family)